MIIQHVSIRGRIVLSNSEATNYKSKPFHVSSSSIWNPYLCVYLSRYILLYLECIVNCQLQLRLFFFSFSFLGMLISWGLRENQFSQVLFRSDLLVLFRCRLLPFLFILVNSLPFALMYACSRFQGARIETLKLNFDYWALLLLLWRPNVIGSRHMRLLSVRTLTHTLTHPCSYICTHLLTLTRTRWYCNLWTPVNHINLSVSIFWDDTVFFRHSIDKRWQTSFTFHFIFAFRLAWNDVRMVDKTILTIHMLNPKSIETSNWEMSVSGIFNKRIHVYACVPNKISLIYYGKMCVLVLVV